MAKIKKAAKTVKQKVTPKPPTKSAKPSKVVKPSATIKAEVKAPTKEAVATVVKVKQTTAAISRIIKGIDNEAVSVKKAHEALTKKIDKINASVSVANKLLSGLSNISVASLPKAIPNPVSKPEGKPSKTPEKVVAAVKAPTTKDTTLSVPKDAPEASSVSNGSRVPLKTAIDDVISSSDKPLSAATIYAGVTSKHGQWSRQSLYNALKDDTRYVKTGDGANAAYSIKSAAGVTVPGSTEEEADALIQKMTDNSAPLANLV